MYDYINNLIGESIANGHFKQKVINIHINQTKLNKQ